MPKPRPDLDAFAELAARPADAIGTAAPASASSANPGTAPPHLLWAALESAYAARDEPSSPFPDEERLAPYLALPLALGVSLVLWVVIVELVLMR